MKKLFAGALLVMMSTSAMAEQPSYDFFQLSWTQVELDDDFIDVDGDGLSLSGSVEIGDNWHIIAGYTDLGFDFGIDLSEFVIGGGYHTAMSTNTSFFANLAWVTAEADVGPFGSADESGIGASIGIRSMVSENWELQGSISYVDLGDAGDGTTLGLGAWYSFSDAFALGLIGGFEEDATSLGIGGRFYF